MSSLLGLALVVNMFFSGLCPGCGRKLSDHLPSRRGPPEKPTAAIVVILGLCYPWGWGRAAALQKMCWVQMSEALTEAEYREKYGRRPPQMERCPCCGGKLRHHGRYSRWLGAERLYIYRGLCKNPACPVVTVTHYPVFVIPYINEASAKVVEEVVRERAEEAENGLTWEKMSEKWGFDVKTLWRWYSAFFRRAKDIINVLLFHEEKYKSAAADGLPTINMETIMRDMFGVADRVAELLSVAGLWREELPGLSLARMARSPGVSPMPVWVW